MQEKEITKCNMSCVFILLHMLISVLIHLRAYKQIHIGRELSWLACIAS